MFHVGPRLSFKHPSRCSKSLHEQLDCNQHQTSASANNLLLPAGHHASTPQDMGERSGIRCLCPRSISHNVRVFGLDWHCCVVRRLGRAVALVPERNVGQDRVQVQHLSFIRKLLHAKRLCQFDVRKTLITQLQGNSRGPKL